MAAIEEGDQFTISSKDYGELLQDITNEMEAAKASNTEIGKKIYGALHIVRQRIIRAVK